MRRRDAALVITTVACCLFIVILLAKNIFPTRQRLSDLKELFRQCETTGRVACPLFWTLGGNQVGKAAVSGWREVLQPALSIPGVRLWPFSGALPELLERKGTVIAETYPGDVYSYVGAPLPPVDGRRGKRHQPSRIESATSMLDWASRAGVDLTNDAEAVITNGFGPSKAGEDAFDALVGLHGMLAVLLGLRRDALPKTRSVLDVEGWILGACG